MGWWAARPEGSEGGEEYGAREPDRTESSGRGARGDLCIVGAWQAFLFSWQNYKVLFDCTDFIMLFFGNWGLALLLLHDPNK